MASNVGEKTKNNNNNNNNFLFQWASAMTLPRPRWPTMIYLCGTHQVRTPVISTWSIKHTAQLMSPVIMSPVINVCFIRENCKKGANQVCELQKKPQSQTKAQLGSYVTYCKKGASSLFVTYCKKGAIHFQHLQKNDIFFQFPDFSHLSTHPPSPCHLQTFKHAQQILLQCTWMGASLEFKSFQILPRL